MSKTKAAKKRRHVWKITTSLPIIFKDGYPKPLPKRKRSKKPDKAS